MRNWLTNLVDSIPCWLGKHKKNYRFNNKGLKHPKICNGAVVYYECTRCKDDGVEYNYRQNGIEYKNAPLPKNIKKQLLGQKRNYETIRRRKHDRVLAQTTFTRKVLFEKNKLGVTPFHKKQYSTTRR